MILWLNGRYQNAEDAMLSSQDRGFLLGDGLFETLRMRAGTPEYFDEHWSRLERSADYFSLALPIPRASAYEIFQELCAKNNLNEAAARLTLSRGSGGRGLAAQGAARPTLQIALSPLPPSFPAEGISAVWAAEPRSTGGCEWSHKTLGLLHNVRALQSAQRQSAEDAIFCDAKGFCLESTMANLFLVRDGILYTPPNNGSILPGIMRAQVQIVADRLGIPVRECAVTPPEVLSAHEVFLSNSLRGLIPVRQVGEVALRKEFSILKKLNQKIEEDRKFGK